MPDNTRPVAYPTQHDDTIPKAHPDTRHYGGLYRLAAALDLPQLAVWLMAELTALGERTWTYAATVHLHLARIRLYVYGLADTVEHRPLTRDDRAALANNHNWTNPHHAADRRFHLDTHVVIRPDVPTLHAHGPRPGTVTVTDAPDPIPADRATPRPAPTPARRYAGDDHD